jgi:prepilin-type processing-associated H-X9-DG protein
MRRPIPWVELLVLNALACVGLAVVTAANRPREHIRVYTCPPNLRQLLTAHAMYRADWDDHWPLSASSDVPPGVLPNPLDSTIDYVKNYQIWLCPNSQTAGADDRVTYVHNGNIYTRRGLAASAVTQPAITPAIRDSDGNEGFRNVLCRPYQQEDRPGPYNDDFHPERLRFHDGGAYYAFCDGHIKLVPGKHYRPERIASGHLRLVP